EMNTVSPESLIRNLLVGKRMADDFGGAMKTGYTATSYGQISQLPQIYAGFDLNCAMTYRGTNKHQIPPICLWEGADGTCIAHIRCFDEVTRTNWFFFLHYELVLRKSPRDLRIKYDPKNLPVHMADDTLYQVAFQLKHEDMDFEHDPDKVRAAVRHFAKQAEPQAIANHLLALDMEDNAVPYVNLPKLIAAVNAVQNDYEARQTTLDEYVQTALTSVDRKSLPVLKGEWRYAAIEAGFNGLLGATHSSRIPLKLLNEEAETELISVAEPLSTFSALMGGQYWRSLLDRAWLKLLKCHPHDSICGAAIDEAHDDMPSRFRDVRMLARETSRKACEDIWEKLDTAASFEQGDLTITFFNSLPFDRKGVVPAVIDTPVTDFGDIYIEPCSGAGPILEGIDVDELITYNYFDVVDEKGVRIPYKVLEKEDLTIEAERKLDSNAIVYNLERHRMLLDVNIPALGYRTYALRPRKREYVTDPVPGSDRAHIAQPHGVLENEFLRIQIQPNGTFDMMDKKAGKQFRGMHFFADDGSVGNAHMQKSPLRDSTITSLGSHATLTLVESNALRGTWRIDLSMSLPAEADLDARNRSRRAVTLPITTWLTLSKDARRLEIRTRFENQARDHRLRVLFPTDIQTGTVDVE
ncbi:MAG TPA: glycoside hydrolase family 38 C-terminal domain-containing protein, partial [bacterium]|nr:glycoside hydrolase family 38 C-terminal domain-containing protein [bacterium]